MNHICETPANYFEYCVLKRHIIRSAIFCRQNICKQYFLQDNKVCNIRKSQVDSETQ